MLAQDVERLAHSAYPKAPESFRATIACDQFIDALQDVDMQVAVRQGRPENIQQALASALEYESIKRAVSPGPTYAARKTHVEESGQQRQNNDLLEQILRRLEQLESQPRPTAPMRRSPDADRNARAGPVTGPCWNCDQMGHLRRDCRRPKRANSTWKSRNSGNE